MTEHLRMTALCVYLRSLRSFSRNLFYRASYICEKLICNEVARCQPTSLRKKLFYALSFIYFAFIFWECIHYYFFWRVCEYNFFQRKVVLLVIYLFNHDSSKSTIFMLNMSFLLSAVNIKLESFVSCNIRLFALCFDIYFFLY